MISITSIPRLCLHLPDCRRQTIVKNDESLTSYAPSAASRLSSLGGPETSIAEGGCTHTYCGLIARSPAVAPVLVGVEDHAIDVSCRSSFVPCFQHQISHQVRLREQIFQLIRARSSYLRLQFSIAVSPRSSCSTCSAPKHCTRRQT